MRHWFVACAIWALALGGGAAAAGKVGPASSEVAAPQVFEPSVTVYISGAVRRPGVYRLPPGTRVADAIQAAGGAARGAAVADLELATVVQDGETVRVPAAGERPRVPSGGQAIVQMPQSFDPRSAGRGSRAGTGHRRKRAPARGAVAGRSGVAVSGRAIVALNRASAAELQRLPGVGPGLAARIIAYRARAGRYQRVEELREVQGIGEKRLARIAPHVDLR